VGILGPNTPGFLEALFGIGAAGSVDVGMLAPYAGSDVPGKKLRYTNNFVPR